MKIYVFLTALILLPVVSCNTGNTSFIAPVSLTCEYLVNPPVVDVLQPRLSWINTATAGNRGQYQTAYQVQAASTEDLLTMNEPDLWDSDKVDSDQSILVSYRGLPLESRQECWWRVRVWDRSGVVSGWSEPAYWGMGLLDPEEWTATWIGAPWQGEEPLPDPVRNEERRQVLPEFPPPAPMLRKAFEVNKEVVAAKAYVTGLGYFELYVNGEKVSEDVLVPNQTNYGKRPGLMNNGIAVEDDFREYRVMYMCYDIKDLLQDGGNVIGAILGNGFYNAPINWTESYGTPRFLGQIYITYADGTEEVIVSDQSWKASQSPIVMDLIYQGEHYDARLEQPGWCTPGFDDSSWELAIVRKAPEGIMKAHMATPDRIMERLEPVAIEKLEDGHYRIDFGQEISGWLNISGARGEAGQKIDIRYLENDSVTAGSGANSFTCSGGGPESYAPRFTWFVFRYVELTNWPGELGVDQLKAEAVYTDIKTTGKFECSNTLFNDINRIWWRSQTDNMHGSIASDCPHRERSPYTGDGQVACVTVMHNFDAGAFYNKWIQDILGAQNIETGYVPNGAPWQPGCGGGVAWGAAINIMPWEFYLHYGDLDMLEYTYEGMKGYVRYMLTWTDEDGIMFSQRTGNNGQPLRWFNLGDWAPAAELPPDDMVHTFYLWRCADLTAQTARALGYTDEAEEFSGLAEKTRLAFQKKFYYEENGTYGPFGGNIFALRMGVPHDQETKVIEALKEDIAAGDGHLDTGIFGTQFFFEVLSDYGMHDLAYEAMNKKTEPSYGWWIEQGATTTWEQWSGRGSRNHPMFGGGLVWLYRKLAGMNADPEHPGYKHIIYKPQPVADVTYTSYTNLTPYGTAGIDWNLRKGKITVNVTVPVGCIATVYVPADEGADVRESGKRIRDDSENVTFVKIEDHYAVYDIESGTYHFETKL
ncbi:MAG: family 78 glycoside hydrolase catalytic domain [Bacteroidales bacterium]|nr:family 78 glycoside hydrolase catalytic domain [Bacteroidales bacterium]